MKLSKWAVFLLFALIVFPCRVHAASFIDDMTVPRNTAETQYFGLKAYTNATHGLSDQQLLTISGAASLQGHAIYRVNFAETITVGIYTSYGTCVAVQDAGPVLGTGTRQALWSKSKDAIYSDFGGSFWRIELDFESRYDMTFAPVSALPSDVIGYGVNIYAMPASDRPLPVSVTRSAAEALCYEEYTAAIPAGTQYIKVEINDVSAYPTKGGGTVANRMYVCLASARISGEALVMGEPAKVEKEPTVVDTAPAGDVGEESEIYSAAFAEPDTPVDTEGGDEPEAEPEKSSSSKFEGTITSSSKAEKSQASRAISPSESSASSSKREESAPSREEDSREAIYEIRRENNNAGMTSGVTVYIIIVAGALGLALIFGRKR